MRIHETTHQRPVERLREEREHLSPLAGSEFSYRPQFGRRVYLDFAVRWKDNFYEVRLYNVILPTDAIRNRHNPKMREGMLTELNPIVAEARGACSF